MSCMQKGRCHQCQMTHKFMGLCVSTGIDHSNKAKCFKVVLKVLIFTSKIFRVDDDLWINLLDNHGTIKYITYVEHSDLFVYAYLAVPCVQTQPPCCVGIISVPIGKYWTQHLSLTSLSGIWRELFSCRAVFIMIAVFIWRTIFSWKAFAFEYKYSKNIVQI